MASKVWLVTYRPNGKIYWPMPVINIGDISVEPLVRLACCVKTSYLHILTEPVAPDSRPKLAKSLYTKYITG